MILRFDQSDRLKVSFGRYHTPINYWNTAFHHGQWLQTTIARPEMIQFGGRFLPVHFVGGLVEGSVPAGGLNLNYKAGVGNGRASVISRGGDAGDINGDRAWLANVFAKPDTVFGLEFGGSVYGDSVTLADAREFHEQIVSGYVVWQKEDPELIAEFAGVRHRRGRHGDATHLEPRVSTCRRPTGCRSFKRLLEAVLSLRAHRHRRRRCGVRDACRARQLDGRPALRRVAVCGDQRRIPHVDARRRHAAQPRRLFPGVFHVLMPTTTTRRVVSACRRARLRRRGVRRVGAGAGAHAGAPTSPSSCTPTCRSTT